MSFQTIKKLFIFSIITTLLIIPGCKKNSGENAPSSTTPVDDSKKEKQINIVPNFTAFYERSLSRTAQSSQQATEAAELFTGTLSIKNIKGQEVPNSPFHTLVKINQTNWTAQLNRTFALSPNQYSLHLDVKQGNNRYIGTSIINVTDGSQQIVTISLHPIIGNSSVSIDKVEQFNRVTFKYPKEQLSQFAAPKLGIKLNDLNEKIFNINKETGETITYIELPKGKNKVKISFLDGAEKLGKSNPVQETVDIDPGENIIMDLVPLEGQFYFDLPIHGGDGNLSVYLPDEAIEEAGSPENLTIRASLIQNGTVKHRKESSATGEPGNHAATMGFQKVYYGDYTLLLEFIDANQQKVLGQCESELSINSNTRSKECSNLRLFRAAYSTGDLLASLHLSVSDRNNKPVDGALIKVDNTIKATTGKDRFDGNGYAHFYHKPGTYTITVSHELGEVEKQITLEPLQSGVNLVFQLQGFLPSPPINRLALGANHSCFTKQDGTVKCWGYGSDGQIGNGKSEQYNTTPQTVIGINNPLMLSAKGHFTCALLQDRTVQCWGKDNQGQLGNDKKLENQTKPVLVSGLENVIAISTGYSHACALLEDNTVKCWGNNGGKKSGYLGVGSTNKQEPLPMAVQELIGVTHIVAGKDYSCALLVDQTVQCWGANGYGQLGIGNYQNQSTPRQTSHHSGVSILAIGYQSGFTKLSNTSLQAWGDNSDYQLGYSGSTGELTAPTNVLYSLDIAKQIAPGESHSCVLESANTVRCWGANNYGQLGRGSIGEDSTPYPGYVKSGNSWGILQGVEELVSGADHSCAWLGEDRVRCWGYNRYGQVGDGTSRETNKKDYNRGKPVSVQGL